MITMINIITSMFMRIIIPLRIIIVIIIITTVKREPSTKARSVCRAALSSCVVESHGDVRCRAVCHRLVWHGMMRRGVVQITLHLCTRIETLHHTCIRLSLSLSLSLAWLDVY